MFYYVYIPWALAGLGWLAAIFLFAMGGGTLMTLIQGKMDKRSHFALSWMDGGLATLKRVHHFGKQGILEGDGELMLYPTPLSNVTYQETPIVPRGDEAPLVLEAIKAENERRKTDAERLNRELPSINEAVKATTMFEGKPLWIYNESIGAAVTPETLKVMEEAKRRMRGGMTQRVISVVSAATIKDFIGMNFSRQTLIGILRAGEDMGLYGRPKKPFNPILILVIFVAVLFILIGVLILTGKLDFSGWLKGLGVG
jgi:hypothetical protein